ncbi:hypothetical protein [Cellulosimicrobium cellulans]|uniref:hypothetical protein n=1 Tax=Cellulosimicrobium cellulans TaxID=1710 RepID=UPI00130E2F10|nr:hypothetical protein [Cellulosimicrobium cellulans]
MSEDLRAGLAEIAVGAARVLRTPPVADLRRRVRRRRAVRRTAGVAAALVAATSVGAAALALGAVPGPSPVAPARPTSSASPSPSPSATPTTATGPVAGWVPGTEPCGTAPAVQLHDSAVVEVQGAVVPGAFDVPAAAFRGGAGDTTLFLNLQTTSDRPGEPAGDGTSDLRVLLLDETGTVAFWNEPGRELPQVESTTSPGTFSPSWLYPALDCRTGRPLSGTFRVIASDADETVELAPVALGDAFDAVAAARTAEQAVQRYQDRPVCGQPLPDAWRRAAADPDLVASFGPEGAPTRIGSAGLHVPVTLTATRAGLEGLVPQGLRAVLVDDSGTVVTGPDGFSVVDGALTGTPFAVEPGGAFASEVFQWWSGCPEPPWAQPTAGDYDLYVLDTVAATDADGRTAPRTVAGGPFRVTFDPTR